MPGAGRIRHITYHHCFVEIPTPEGEMLSNIINIHNIIFLTFSEIFVAWDLFLLLMRTYFILISGDINFPKRGTSGFFHLNTVVRPYETFYLYDVCDEAT